MPTHGSLTKAGKVRGQTPKIEGKKENQSNIKIKKQDQLCKEI